MKRRSYFLPDTQLKKLSQLSRKEGAAAEREAILAALPHEIAVLDHHSTNLFIGEIRQFIINRHV